MPVPEASVSTIKGWLKLGRDRMGVSVMAVLRGLNVDWAVESHLNASILRSGVRGAALAA